MPKPVSPVTGKRRWKQYRDGDLCHLSIVAEYQINAYNYAFVAYSEINSCYLFAIYDTVAAALARMEKFNFRYEADMALIAMITAKWQANSTAKNAARATYPLELMP